MATKQKVKDFLNHVPSVKAAAYVVDDFVQGLRLASGQLGSNSGTTHAQLSITESLSYIEEVFNDYKKYGNLDKFFGRAVEIGPGDNAGVALLMKNDGCTQVDLVDRYFSYRDPEQQSRIYEALAQKYKLEQFKTKNTWNQYELPGITWKIGQAAEIFFNKSAQQQSLSYDFIVSRSAMEHLYNPLDTLRDMVKCLKVGGQMFHKIDFKDHGMFTPRHHELTFLEIPSHIYPLMVQKSGRPNRILLHRYRDVLESMKKSGLIDYSILVTQLVNVGTITPHEHIENIPLEKQQQSISFVEKYRKNFATEFSDVESRDLAVSGIFLKVRKI